jgi:hypothetical protein
MYDTMPGATRESLRETIMECERVGHAKGLAAGLSTALAAAGATDPPGRIAALPTDQVPEGAAVVPNAMAEQEGISFVRWPESSAEPALDSLAVLLGAVRIGVTRNLMEHAVTHLSGRTSGGEPTVRKQLVLGAIADAMTAADAARECLLVAGDVPAAVVDTHDRLTELDWEATKLLGASGFITDSPARAGYVSRLAANCWVPRGDT